MELENLQKSNNKMKVAVKFYNEHPDQLGEDLYDRFKAAVRNQPDVSITFEYLWNRYAVDGSVLAEKQIIDLFEKTCQIKIDLTDDELAELNNEFADSKATVDDYLTEIMYRAWFDFTIDQTRLIKILSTQYYVGYYGYVVIDNGKYHIYGDSTEETQENELCYRANYDDLAQYPDDFPVYANVHDFNDDRETDFDREAFEYLDKFNLMRIINEFIDEYHIFKCQKNVDYIADYALSAVDWQDFENYVETDMAECDLEDIQENIPITPTNSVDYFQKQIDSKINQILCKELGLAKDQMVDADRVLYQAQNLPFEDLANLKNVLEDLNYVDDLNNYSNLMIAIADYQHCTGIMAKLADPGDLAANTLWYVLVNQFDSTSYEIEKALKATEQRLIKVFEANQDLEKTLKR